MVLWLTLRKLQSRDPEARKAAAKELASASSPQPKAFEALVAQLGAEPVPGVRCALVEALGRTARAEAIPPILSCLDGDEEWDVKVVAAAALGRAASVDAVPSLVRAVCGSSPRLRAEACRALDSIGWQPADASLGAWRCVALKDWSGAATLGEDTFAALETLLQQDDFDTVAEGITELGATPRSTQLLARALDTSRYEFQRLPLLTAAAKLKDPCVAEAVLALLEKLETEEDDARQSGGVLGGSFLYSDLKKIGTQRLAAIEALGELGDFRVVEPLQSLRERLTARQAAANNDSQARMVETLQTRGADGMGDALFGTLTGYLDPAESAKVDDAIAAVLARLA